jgi:hypothetical protein
MDNYKRAGKEKRADENSPTGHKFWAVIRLLFIVLGYLQ